MEKYMNPILIDTQLTKDELLIISHPHNSNHIKP